MLKLYFNTTHKPVNSGSAKKSEIYNFRCWVISFVICVISLFLLSGLVACDNSQSAYNLSQLPSANDSETPADYTYENLVFYRPVNAGERIEFAVSAVDPDEDQLAYSAFSLPDGASFDTETATFSWTPRYDQAGEYVVRFEVTDGELSDYEDVTITVIQPYEAWDVNGDEATNVLDMILVGQHLGETGLTGWIAEDVNRDGTIDVLDMVIIGQNWTG